LFGRKKRSEDLMFFIYKKNCMDCGKDFEVKVRAKDGAILDDSVYLGTIKRRIGTWTAYTVEKDSNGNWKWKRIHPLWKHVWYLLKDKKRELLHQYEEVEMWECPKCARKEKKRSQKKSLRKSLTPLK